VILIQQNQLEDKEIIKMKKIILSVAVATVVSSVSLNAMTFEERIQKLESQIAQMKADKTENIEMIDELDERVSDVEFRSYTDKISFGVGLRVENNNYSNDKANGTSWSSTINRVKVNLNMKSKIDDNMKFVGRLSMYKNWGDQTPRMEANDYAQGRRPNGSDLYVERAYVDWKLNPADKVPVTLSLGRLSTTDGPSYNIKEDTKRKGTFSALAYDWAMDGVIVTANLNKVVKGMDMQFTYFTPSVQDEPKTISEIGYDGIEDTTVAGLIINKTCDKLPFKNDMQVYYIPATDTSAPGMADGIRKNLGDMILSGFMLEATKIGGKVDAFVHYATNTAKPNGQTVNMGTAGNWGLIQSANQGETTVSTDELTGDAIWLGARYHINKQWKVGAEYNKGSKNWFSFTVGSNDPTNKLAVRGDATELYVTKSINKYANFRVGYVNINLDYTNPGMIIGTPYDIDSAQAKAMGAVSKSTNTYISFNLLF
jgi:hypothetical protein